MVVKNSTELKSILMRQLEKVISSVADILLQELEDIIQEEVYNAYSPSFYDRQENGSLKNSWEHDIPISSGDEVHCLIYQNYDSLRSDIANWVHGSLISGELSENGLNDIVNYGKIGDVLNFPQLGARPFWDKFQEYVDKHLGEIFIRECEKEGIPLSSVTHGYTFY